MPTNIGSLLWVSGIDNTKLRRDANQSSQIIGGVGRTADSVTNQLRSMAGALGLVAGGAGLVSLGRQVIEVRGQFQQLGIAFETMLGSKEKADKLMNDAVTFAAKTPFTLTDVSTNIKQLMAMGIETKNVMNTMKALGDVAAGVSVPISRVAINYGQVATLGKLQTRELKDFALAGIPLMEQLSKSLGKSKNEIQDMVTAGQVGFPMVEQAFKDMSSEGGQFYNLMEKQNASVTGQISNLTDKWEVMLNEIGKSNEGLIYGGINGLSELIANYETILDILKVLVTTYGAYRAAIILTNVSQAVSTRLGVYDIATKELQVGATVKATLAQNALNKAIMANPYVFALAAIVAVGSALVVFSEKAKTTEEIVKDLNDTVAQVGKQLEIDKAIDRFEKLEGKVNKTKDEQKEFNGLIKELSDIFPSAVTKYDDYGNAVGLVTDKLIKNNEQLKEALRLGAKLTEQETKDELAKKIAERDALVKQQNTGKKEVSFQNKGATYTNVITLSEDDLSKNKDRINTLNAEISQLAEKAKEADTQLTKLGTKAADEFIKKHQKLFAEVNTLTREQARKNRDELLALFDSANANEKEAIKQKAEELDIYAKTIKTTREETAQWTEDLAKAQEKLKELQDPSYESKTGTPGQDIADQEKIVKDLKEKLGISKKDESEARKLIQERLEYETEIGRKRIEAELKIRQDLLNLQEDSDEKARKQAQLNYEKTLNDIATRKAEQLKKYRELYGSNATLPKEDQAIFNQETETAEKIKNAAIEQINEDAAKRIKEIWKKVHDARLSDMEREKAAVDEKYKEEIKAAKKAKDFELLNALNKNVEGEKAAITRKYQLDELDFLQEIELRKNEIATKGADRENELAKTNFETFKKYQEKKIAILRAAGDPESLKQAELLQTNLDLNAIDESKRKSQELANNFFDAANYARDLSNAIGDSNRNLAELFTGVSNLANAIGDLAAKGAFSEGGLSDSDAIGAMISGATQLIGIVVSQAARNKKEMADYYDAVITQQHRYNLALNEQIRLNNQINGSIFYNDFAQTLEDSAEALADANEKRDEAMAKFWNSEAIVGKENVVSGQNVLSGIGAGATLGFGLGTIVPGIGNVVGAAVGAIVGGLVGLFAKKKKDILKPLLQTYPELIDANGKFNVELAKTLVGTENITKETSRILQDVIDWEEAAQKAREQIIGVIEDLTGTIGSDLRNALVDAFENGTDSAIKFGEDVKKILENIVSQQIFNALFGPALDKLQADLLLSSGVDANGDAATGTGVDGNMVDDILRFYDRVPELTDAFNEALSAVRVPGFNLFDGSTPGQTNTSTGNIQRALTEDTGSALMGLWRRSLDEQKTQSEILNKSNGYLIEISSNTLRTANNTDKLEKAVKELESISENTRKSYLNDLGL